MTLAWPLVCALAVFARNYEPLVSVMPEEVLEQITVNEFVFYRGFLVPQLGFLFLLVLVVAPAAIAPDLRNNGLALYLSRPIGKVHYLAGKFAIPVLLGTAITVVPGLVLFALQTSLAGTEWAFEHPRILFGLVGVFFWVLLLSLVAMMLTVWVQWKAWARIAFLAVFPIGQVMALILNLRLQTWAGGLIDLQGARNRMLEGLLGLEPLLGQSEMTVPIPAAWFVLLLAAALSTLLLFWRLRAYEVVK